MKKKLLLFLFSISILTLTSCEKDPTGTGFISIRNTTNIEHYIVINNNEANGFALAPQRDIEVEVSAGLVKVKAKNEMTLISTSYTIKISEGKTSILLLE